MTRWSFLVLMVVLTTITTIVTTAVINNIHDKHPSTTIITAHQIKHIVQQVLLKEASFLDKSKEELYRFYHYTLYHLYGDEKNFPKMTRTFAQKFAHYLVYLQMRVAKYWEIDVEVVDRLLEFIITGDHGGGSGGGGGGDDDDDDKDLLLIMTQIKSNEHQNDRKEEEEEEEKMIDLCLETLPKNQQLIWRQLATFYERNKIKVTINVTQSSATIASSSSSSSSSAWNRTIHYDHIVQIINQFNVITGNLNLNKFSGGKNSVMFEGEQLLLLQIEFLLTFWRPYYYCIRKMDGKNFDSVKGEKFPRKELAELGGENSDLISTYHKDQKYKSVKFSTQINDQDKDQNQEQKSITNLQKILEKKDDKQKSGRGGNSRRTENSETVHKDVGTKFEQQLSLHDVIRNKLDVLKKGGGPRGGGRGRGEEEEEGKLKKKFWVNDNVNVDAAETNYANDDEQGAGGGNSRGGGRGRGRLKKVTFINDNVDANDANNDDDELNQKINERTERSIPEYSFNNNRKNFDELIQYFGENNVNNNNNNNDDDDDSGGGGNSQNIENDQNDQNGQQGQNGQKIVQPTKKIKKKLHFCGLSTRDLFELFFTTIGVVYACKYMVYFIKKKTQNSEEEYWPDTSGIDPTITIMLIVIGSLISILVLIYVTKYLHRRYCTACFDACCGDFCDCGSCCDFGNCDFGSGGFYCCGWSCGSGGGGGGGAKGASSDEGGGSSGGGGGGGRGDERKKRKLEKRNRRKLRKELKKLKKLARRSGGGGGRSSFADVEARTERTGAEAAEAETGIGRNTGTSTTGTTSQRGGGGVGVGGVQRVVDYPVYFDPNTYQPYLPTLPQLSPSHQSTRINHHPNEIQLTPISALLSNTSRKSRSRSSTPSPAPVSLPTTPKSPDRRVAIQLPYESTPVKPGEPVILLPVTPSTPATPSTPKSEHRSHSHHSHHHHHHHHHRDKSIKSLTPSTPSTPRTPK